MALLVYWQHNDNVLILDALKDYIADTYINDASVTATLKDTAGNAVTGATDLVMSYVAGSDGQYRATIPYDITCTCRRMYTVEITADGGSDRRGFWEVPVRIDERTQT